MSPPQTDQNRVAREVGSSAHRRDGSRTAPTRSSESKSLPAALDACPSPYGDSTIKHSSRKLFSDFHPGLLGLYRKRSGEMSLPEGREIGGRSVFDTAT